MRFHFDKSACQNLRRILRREWLETNGLGDYASSTLICCNTRKYHGLFVAETAVPPGRHVLLSTIEESLCMAGKEFFFSCRKHPGVYYPRGHEYMQSADPLPWPCFSYRFGDVLLLRELLMLPGRHVLLIRYTARTAHPETPPMTLRLKPLLAFRNMHSLRQNDHISTASSATLYGASLQPEPDLPPLFLQMAGATYTPAPDWYYNAEYMVERERGFPCLENLFMPGVFTITLEPGKAAILAVSTETLQREFCRNSLPSLWDAECARRQYEEEEHPGLQGHLVSQGTRFLIKAPSVSAAPIPPAPDQPQADSVVAGYHWFGAWGRDTLISLPGLTFYAGRQAAGEHILAIMAAALKNGRIPNVFSADGQHAYNCVDASLWYIWAVQMLLRVDASRLGFVREHCWPAIQEIVRAYGSGRIPHVHPDEEGFLDVGNAQTQLTWMDATVHGRPVTPRWGQPVEISALWYNALTFADELARRFDAAGWQNSQALRQRMRTVFVHRHWTSSAQGDYLADVWCNGERDMRVRPNQLFAVSLPNPLLGEEWQAAVVSRVRLCLLTPYGLRTLAPSAPDYRPVYEGGPDERDSAYHQGCVWPWLLGAYGDALLRAAWDEDNAVRELLHQLTPLFSRHLGEAGVGSLSEIFDGDPPHQPDGCIAQAWSVAECLRLLRTLEKAAPAVYAQWEATLQGGR